MDLSNRDGRRILGDRIKRATKEAGISLDELAVRIGCSRALIYQYVSGASLAQPDRLQQISAVVGKPLSWFFEDEPSAVVTPGVVSAESATRNGAVDGRHVKERVGYLRELVGAYSSPPDWRRVADTCQQLVALLQGDSDDSDIAEILFTHGNALLRLQEYGAAKTKLEEAGSYFRELGLSSRNLDCLQSIGNADVHLGRTMQALNTFRHIAEGAEWRHRWQGMLSIGAVHEMLGDYSAAADAFVRAQEIIGENSDTRATEGAYLYIDGNWANLELAWGDYERALETGERCVGAAQRLGDQDQYVEALLSCASAHLGLGNFRQAAFQSHNAVNVAELIRDYERWSLGLASRSLAHTSCRIMTKAIVDAKEALSIALRHGCHRAEIFAQKAIALAYYSVDNIVEARYHVDQALAAAEAGHLRLPHVEFQVLSASLARAAGDLGRATELAKAAQTVADALDAKQVQHDCALVLAEAARDASNWTAAAEYAKKAIATAGLMQAPWLTWKSQEILADALDHQGKKEEAGEVLASAISSLNANRRCCAEGAGNDTLPEAPAVRELWLKWVFFLEETGRADEAANFVEHADWEPLEIWIQEKRDGGK